MEREMGGLYRDLAAAHAGDRRLAQLWMKTAREEDNHAHQFELALRYDDQLGALLVGADAVAALVELIRERRRGFAGSPPSPVDALRAAVDLEDRFAHFHMSTVADFRSPNLRKLFEAMMAADRAHSAALREALAARN
jgi:hypothetical protein